MSCLHFKSLGFTITLRLRIFIQPTWRGIPVSGNRPGSLLLTSPTTFCTFYCRTWVELLSRNAKPCWQSKKLNAVSRPSILHAALVCKGWYTLSQSLIYQTLDLTLGPGSHQKNYRLFQRLSDDSTLGPLIREIHVCDWFASGLMLDHSTIMETTNWL
jgi:hypothetical protein